MIKMVSLIIAMLTSCSTFATGVPNEEITFGTFIECDGEYAQFKSYDDTNWWFLTYEEIGEEPELNKPVAIVYDNNGTTKCDECAEEDDCECWVYDDEFKKIIKNY